MVVEVFGFVDYFDGFVEDVFVGVYFVVGGVYVVEVYVDGEVFVWGDVVEDFVC